MRRIICAMTIAAAGLATAARLWADADDPMADSRRAVDKEVAAARLTHDLTPEKITDDQIVDSMKRAIDYLFKQKTNDNWESVDSWSRDPKEGEMKGGETALVLLALLEAGQSIDDPRLKFRSPELAPVVDYVLKLQTDRTYVLGMQASALALLPQSKDQKFNAALARIKDLLVASIEQNPGYGYSVKKENNAPLPPYETGFDVPFRGKSLKFNWKWDNSNSQYALLGVWAAADAGLPVPPEYWAVEDSLWRVTQCKNGSWTYEVPVDKPAIGVTYGTNEISKTLLPPSAFQRPTITAAALASLYVTQEFLDTDLRLEPRIDHTIDNGLKSFTETLDPLYADGYYLYGIERVGLASGYKYFGTTDWYRELACTLLATQQDSGAWQYTENVGTSPNVGTAYGLLTLARGRNPVLFNKLEYSGPWNARPRDDANLTRWMSRAFERERAINWQIVNMKVPGDEWLDAPILLITGSRDPNFTKEQLSKIKAYIDGGGMVFSTADGGNEAFTAAMKKYAVEITGRTYEFRVLPKDHPIFNLFFDIKAPPIIWGLSNGSRELWVHSVTDMGAAWQRRNMTTKAFFEIPGNIYFYASGRGKLRPRLQPLTPTGGEEKRTVTVGRLQYGGNWDFEPGAWPRFASVAKALWSVGVNAIPVKATALDVAKTPVVHMTGTGTFTLSPEEIAGIKAYIEKGGRFILDAGGGAPGFTQSAKDLIKTLDLGGVQPLLAGDPIFSGNSPGTEALAKFEYRGPVIERFKGEKPDGSLLQGVKIGDRLAIVLSAEDIYSGLLGSHTWIAGYEPETAISIMRDLVVDLSVAK